MPRPLGINTGMFMESDLIEKQLSRVQTTMMNCLCNTRLAPLLSENPNLLGGGKMLRARLTLSLGRANGIDEQVLTHAAAAVDIIHGASLLHDDVIDGGILRRNEPTFWKKHGVNGAILFGDLLVYEGLNLLFTIDRVDLVKELMNRSREVCCSEVEQELVLRGTEGTWEECEQIARTKTGALFAFAAVAASNGSKAQINALREAGYLLGTAYQLADDLLDASGNEALSGKTLGTDHARGKTTAFTATQDAPKKPIEYIPALLDCSSDQLKDWPDLQQAWNNYLDSIMNPILERHLSAG